MKGVTTADRLSHVLWLSGISGVGKTTAARALARQHDLRLYSLDSHTYEHAARLPTETRTLDELWVDTTPTSLAEWFESHARARFPLVVDDLLSLPADAPVIADGPQLLPQLIAPVLASRAKALFVVARPELQRRLVVERGSDLYERTRDSKRALENRLGRDEVLVARMKQAASRHGLSVIEVSEVAETRAAIDAHFLPLLRTWLAGGDRGDVAARRRDENDARLRQWRAHVTATEAGPAGEIEVACECDRPGCEQVVRIGLVEAEAVRAKTGLLIVSRH